MDDIPELPKRRYQWHETIEGRDTIVGFAVYPHESQDVRPLFVTTNEAFAFGYAQDVGAEVRRCVALIGDETLWKQTGCYNFDALMRFAAAGYEQKDALEDAQSTIKDLCRERDDLQALHDEVCQRSDQAKIRAEEEMRVAQSMIRLLSAKLRDTLLETGKPLAVVNQLLGSLLDEAE